MFHIDVSGFHDSADVQSFQPSGFYGNPEPGSNPSSGGACFSDVMEGGGVVSGDFDFQSFMQKQTVTCSAAPPPSLCMTTKTTIAPIAPPVNVVQFQRHSLQNPIAVNRIPSDYSEESIGNVSQNGQFATRQYPEEGFQSVAMSLVPTSTSTTSLPTISPPPAHLAPITIVSPQDHHSPLGEVPSPQPRQPELRSAHSDYLPIMSVDPREYKTRMCSVFEELGLCPYGNACAYAHGFKQLRPVSINIAAIHSISILALQAMNNNNNNGAQSSKSGQHSGKSGKDSHARSKKHHQKKSRPAPSI